MLSRQILFYRAADSTAQPVSMGQIHECLRINPFSARTVFIRQNLTSVDVRF